MPKNIQQAVMISIHAPARGATEQVILTVWTALFQSTLPRGERQRGFVYQGAGNKFQSTLPRGERHFPIHCSLSGLFLFQSTLPRGERREFDSKETAVHIAISIHAPARGATSFVSSSPVSGVISIHAPARGAT